MPVLKPDNIAEVVRAATGGRGVDIALNGVGAWVFQPMMASLAEGGRMAVYSVSFGGREVKVDLFPLYRKRQELIGINSIPLGRGARRPESSPNLSRCLKVADSTPPRVTERYPLAEAVKAYERVRSAQGKVAFVINEMIAKLLGKSKNRLSSISRVPLNSLRRRQPVCVQAMQASCCAGKKPQLIRNVRPVSPV